MSPVDLPIELSSEVPPFHLTLPPNKTEPITSIPPVTPNRSGPDGAMPMVMPIPRQALIAAITFDALGLPEQYFGSPRLKGKIVGAKLMGRVLSLQSLLMSSLQLGSFSYAKTTCEAYTTIVIVAQDSRYIALLFDPATISRVTTSALCQWMRQLDGLAVQRLWEQL